jgi:hypothetical protein
MYYFQTIMVITFLVLAVCAGTGYYIDNTWAPGNKPIVNFLYISVVILVGFLIVEGVVWFLVHKFFE